MKMSLRVLGIFLVCVGFLLVQLLLSGCGGFKMQEVHTLLEAENPEAAYAYMAEKGPRENSIWADPRRFAKESGYLFERALVAHYARRFSESHRDFSLTENPPKKGYPGTSFEKLMRHYYQILNYLYLNRLEQALAECHRAMVYISDSQTEGEDDALLGAGLLAHLSGMCFEAAGEWNDAFSSYQQAETFYQQAALKTEIKMPTDVGEALVRLARQLELYNEASRYLRQYGEPHTPADGIGELILFYESGYVPRNSNERFTFPILQIDTTNEVFGKINKNKQAIARDFVVNTLLDREGQSYADKDLEYVLRVDLPARQANRPNLMGIAVQTDNSQQNGVLVADIQAMAQESYNAKRTSLLIDTTTHVFRRYINYRNNKYHVEQKKKREKKLEIQKEEREKEIQQRDLPSSVETQKLFNVEAGHRVGKLTSDLIYAQDENERKPGTGNADRRFWKMLPNQIFLVRMQLPQGIHNLTLSFLDANGQYTESQILQNVEISPNHITFLNFRTYK